RSVSFDLMLSKFLLLKSRSCVELLAFVGMWVSAAVQSIDSLMSVAASTALTIFLVSVVVGKDRRSMPTGHGKQITAAAGVPPDSKGTNRRSIAVAGISPPAWQSALSRAAFSKHWLKSLQTFSPA